MRRIILLSMALFFLFIVNAFAQPGPRGQAGRRSIDERLAHLTQVLDLNEKQQAEVRSILEDHDKKVKKAIEENNGDRRAIQAAIRDLTDQANAQIMNVLGDKQKEKFKEFLKEQKKQREDRPERPPQRGGRRF